MMLRRLSRLAGPSTGGWRSMQRSLGIDVPGLNLLPENWPGRSSHSAAWGLKSPTIPGRGSGQGRAGAGGRGRGRRGRLEDEESGSISRGSRMVMARRPIRGGGASNRQIDDALYWAMVRIRIANGEEETSVLGLSSTLTRLADEAEERRPIGEGWFNVPTGLTEALTGKKGSSADSVEGLKKMDEEDVPWWERYMKGKDELDPRGLGAFVNLFRKDKNPRKLGPLWHMYQFCIAMIPSLFIICLANSVTGRDLSKMPEQFTSADKIAFAAMRRKEYEKECAEKGIPVPSSDKKDLPWYRRF